MRFYPMPRNVAPARLARLAQTFRGGDSEMRNFYSAIRGAVETGASLHAAQTSHYRVDSTRFDSDSINLLIDFRARLAEIYRDKFPALRARDFVPTLSAPIQQTSSGFIGTFLSRVGEARIVTALSTDVPLVRVTGTTFTGSLVHYGAAGAWSQLDVFRASLGQVSLPVETQRAARETVDTKTDELISLGDGAAGIPGFLNNTAVAILPLTTGNWGGAGRTFTEVLADFHEWIAAIHARVNYIESSLPDTVLFAPAVRNTLARIRNAGDNKVTAWDALVDEARKFYGISVDVWSRLATASATGGARAVAYRRDPKILGAVVSMEYQEFPPQERGYDIIVPAIAGCGGTFVIESRGVHYTDNTLS